MGRRSLVDERRAQIIAEAAKTIGRYGLEGATQERIAEDCGLSRSHIRHYVGNRDDLIDAVWDYVMTPYVQSAENFRNGTGPATSLADMVDYLFGPEMEANDDDAVINALSIAAMKDESLRDRLYATQVRIEEAMVQTLRNAAPGATLERATDVAYTLLSVAIGSSSLSALPFPASRRLAARRYAHSLIDTFVQESGAVVST